MELSEKEKKVVWKALVLRKRELKKRIEECEHVIKESYKEDIEIEEILKEYEEELEIIDNNLCAKFL